MDWNVKDLIALGSSEAGHCRSCLTCHLRKAREMGIDEQNIREEIEVGQMVEKGAGCEWKTI